LSGSTLPKSAGTKATMLAFAVFLLFVLPMAAASNQMEMTNLKLNDYLQLVLQHNESIQAHMLEAEANHRRAQAETGIFEPDLTLSAAREYNKRQNNAEEQSALLGQPVFQEDNNIYNGWLETLMPTGAKIRLGTTMSDLNNNITPLFSTNAFGRQY